MFLIIHLEVLDELFVEKTLELLLIFFVDETIIEDSKDFVAPELDDLLLRFVEVLVGHVQSLEHLGDITHVKAVMTLGRCGKELILRLVEEVNCRNSDWLNQTLDLFIELGELDCCNRFEDPLHLGVAWHGEVKEMELREHSV